LGGTSMWSCHKGRAGAALRRVEKRVGPHPPPGFPPVGPRGGDMTVGSCSRDSSRQHGAMLVVGTGGRVGIVRSRGRGAHADELGVDIARQAVRDHDGKVTHRHTPPIGGQPQCPDDQNQGAPTLRSSTGGELAESSALRRREDGAGGAADKQEQDGGVHHPGVNRVCGGRRQRPGN